jgi:Na+/H+ antiporter NhaC
MSEAAAEVIHIENAFGTVTDRRIIYFRSKGWFSDGSKEVISLQRVTSVRFEISRPVLLAVPLLLLGLILLRGNGVLAILGGAAIALAVLLLWGSPVVIVNAGARGLNKEKGWPWQKPDAEAFVETLREGLVHTKKSGEYTASPPVTRREVLTAQAG